MLFIATLQKSGTQRDDVFGSASPWDQADIPLGLVASKLACTQTYIHTYKQIAHGLFWSHFGGK